MNSPDPPMERGLIALQSRGLLPTDASSQPLDRVGHLGLGIPALCAFYQGLFRFDEIMSRRTQIYRVLVAPRHSTKLPVASGG